ncbi:MAG: cysteine--tRNA ligase, partial [Candidatus Levybacteria bacterium]|nr:cysteine--tRNA ligase [Candidatus Levybacteria bacterium]
MYACGPTVYDFAHIGNFRTYAVSDFLLKTLQYNGYEVKYIMNLTDVGHLTGDNLGDADMGEDRMEKSAAREGKSAWEIAAFYTEAFLKDFAALNLTKPKLFAKATDHIKEQIDLIKRLEEKGFTYEISDGIYFDTAKFPEYGKLSNLDEIKAGARIEINPEKKSPRDFALWKFSVPRHSGLSRIDSGVASLPRMTETPKRQMEWKSPWGVGFPGWHIECSAMSMKYLGESFDIHTGGVDLRETHHPNEIAQAEAVTGKPFVKYWVHPAFVLVKGERMSKSLGNNYKLYDLEEQKYDPLALRYLYLQTHYRQEMNFTFPALDAAQQALNHLRSIVSEWDSPKIGCAEYEKKFLTAINDDFNFPEALAIIWDLVKSDYPSSAKAQSLFKFDEVLGLNLSDIKKIRLLEIHELPQEVQELVRDREKLRKEKKYMLADQLRSRIKKSGYDVTDTKRGIEIKEISK